MAASTNCVPSRADGAFASPALAALGLSPKQLLEPGQTAALAALLKAHLVAGRAAGTASLRARSSLRTLAGTTIKVSDSSLRLPL